MTVVRDVVLPAVPAPPKRSFRRVKRDRVAILLATIVYIGGIFLVYRNVVAPTYGYFGFSYRTPPMAWFLGSLGLSVLPTLWLPTRYERPSQMALWILYGAVIIPTCMIPWLTLENPGRDFAVFVAFLVGMFALLHRLLVFGTGRTFIRLPRLPPVVYWSGILAASVVCYLLIHGGYGFAFRPGLFGEGVYGVRLEARDTVAAYGTQAAYAMFWMGEALQPLIIAVGVVYRRWTLVAVGALGQIVLFSVTGLKSLIFTMALVVAAVYVANPARWHRFGRLMAFGFLALPLVGLLSQYFAFLIVRRALFSPGLLTGFYFDFFSKNPQVHLSDSIFSGVAAAPYSRSYTYEIGTTYLHNPLSNANANVWADGFANFGYSGVLIATVLLAVVLLAIDSITVGRDPRLAASVGALAAWAFTNSALLGSLSTHGVLLMIALVGTLPNARHRVAPRVDRRVLVAGGCLVAVMLFMSVVALTGSYP